jgi:hypothetical protein
MAAHVGLDFLRFTDTATGCLPYRGVCQHNHRATLWFKPAILSFESHGGPGALEIVSRSAFRCGFADSLSTANTRIAPL